MSHDPPASPPPGSKPPGSTGPNPHSRDTSRDAWAAGGSVFAGLMLVIAGALAILEGVVGISKDVVYLRTHGSYTYKFDVTTWGWIHLVIGVIAVLVGSGLLSGAAWARYAGIFVAGISLIANFMFLPYQPVWAIVLVAIDTFIIWALATYRPGSLRHGGAV